MTPDRRAVLHGLAALVASGAVPVDDPDVEDESLDEDDLVDCDVCGGGYHPDDVDHTAVATTGTIQADICRVCQFKQNYDPGPDRCRSCGDDVDLGFYVELEFPLGVAGLPANFAGTLCADCAEDVGHRLHGTRFAVNDPDADERFLDIMHEATIRANELRDDWPRGDDDE